MPEKIEERSDQMVGRIRERRERLRLALAEYKSALKRQTGSTADSKLIKLKQRALLKAAREYRRVCSEIGLLQIKALN